MTKLLVVCLGVVLSLPVNETFTVAERIGHTPRAFFRFSTSVAKYTIRFDGFVEVYVDNDMNLKRKRVFFLKMAGKGRLEEVYFLEHEGDLWLRYDVIGGGSYLTRIEQRSRKQRWVTPLNDASGEAPVIYGDKVLVGTLEIRKSDGRVVGQD
jgi:hypothetical protein